MSFENIFTTKPTVKETVTGRVNLLGEHTDYNNGLVLPMHIPQKMCIEIAIAEDRDSKSIHMYSASSDVSVINSVVSRSIDEPKQMHWSDYVIGSLQICQQAYGKELPALNIYIESAIPNGAGVSSSSALEVGIIKAIRSLLHLQWGDLDVAKMARKAENEYVGMPCGLMDQMIISMGSQNSALLIDFADMDNPAYEEMQLFDTNTYKFSVVFSGVQHKLVAGDDGYKTRRMQCESAAKKMGVKHLSEISFSQLEKLDVLDDEILYKRAYHIITENKRVIEASRSLKNNDVKKFGTCMTESHISQRDNFAVSVEEIDAIVEVALENNAIGARLTGGGFGGSVVFLSHKDISQKIWEEIQKIAPKAQLLV